MQKAKWFTVGYAKTIGALVKVLDGASFNIEQGFGFAFAERRPPSRYCFEYLKQSTLQVPYLLVDGSVAFQEVKTVARLTFEIFDQNGKIWIKVDEPPRSIRDFLNSLEKVVGFGFSIQPYQFSLAEQHLALEKFDSVRLVGFRGVGSSALLRLVARIDVASKEGFDAHQLPLVDGLDFKTEQTTYEVTHKMLRGQVTFTGSGLVRIAGALAPLVTEKLESSL